ncbi:hypothetical protein DPMN_042922 [Dreissena polymorpha]|uniref:RING-type domain-containing protein n=3 Tax=Dreissena polymorpha TaxID=45954 RepID=A0A9D4HXC2_DREPO|nr:hypothetical protein DPMN_042922 [Dreissena polymorpha]
MSTSSFVPIRLTSGWLMFLICISLSDRQCCSTIEHNTLDKYPRCGVNAIKRDSKELALGLAESIMRIVLFEDYFYVRMFDHTFKTLDGIPSMVLGKRSEETLYRTQTRVNVPYGWLAYHQKWKLITKTSWLHNHYRASAAVMSLAQKIQSAMNTATEFQYSDMFTSLDSLRKLSEATLTALRLLLILYGIEPNPGPFNKANGAGYPAFDDWARKSVFVLNVDRELEATIWNKNSLEARYTSFRRILLTIGRSCGSNTACLYIRDKKIFILFTSKLLSKKDFVKANKPFPQSFFVYLNDDGAIQMCRISPDLSSFLAPVNEYITSGIVTCLDYNDFKPSVSLVQNTKTKVLSITEDDTHLAGFNNSEYNLQIYTHEKEDSPNPAYPVENEEQSTIAVQAVDDVDGFHSFVATSSSLSELPIPRNYQSQTQSTSQVQQHRDSITPLQIHESSIVSRIELDISERYDQSEIRCNSSTPEVSNTHRWRGEATDYPTAKYPRYAAVEDRTASFRNWPRTRPTIPALCQSGFFCTGNDDLVRCFCCGIGLKDFSDTDDPLQEHVRHSRNCAYLIVLLGGQDGMERYHRSLPTHDPEEIRRQQRLRYNSQQSVPATGYRARHERLRSLQSRLDTFTNWPSHVTQRPQELAEAGLYYTGIDDHCRCFACDGGLRKWEHGDDPWIEHCRWFPACPYAREVKGRDFIDLIQLSADQAAEENASAPQEDMTNSLAGMSIEDPLVQRIVDRHDSMLKESMGYSEEDIKQAVLELVQQGNKTPSIEDIVTQIEVIAERNAVSRDFQIIQNVQQTEDGMMEENIRLKGILMCCICGTNHVNILFLPCTHLKVCLECSRNLRSCPLCKREIKDKIRTYML